MTWSYHKRIRIIPGVRLNVSRSGISTAIGIWGANAQFKLLSNTPGTAPALQNTLSRPSATGQDRQPLPVQPAAGDNIFSADVQEITSQNMQGIKEAIMMAQQQRSALEGDVHKIQQAMSRYRMKLNMSYILLYGLLKRSVAVRLKATIQAQQETIDHILEQASRSCVSLEVGFEPGMLEKYNRLLTAFKQLAGSEKIWDVTSERYQDRVAARSSASTLVSRREVRFSITPLPYIDSDFEVLHFQNANGSDLYLYPGFMVMHASADNFALIGIEELSFSHRSMQFTETERVPGDSKIIDTTWEKVNKNGTPDRRFSNNRQLPVVRYGEITLKTATGLHEAYKCSNYEATEAFSNAFHAYQASIRRIADR